MNAIYDLHIEAQGHLSQAYKNKMQHRIPVTRVVNRERFLLDRARGKVVLDIGCIGPMGRLIEQVALEYHGVDKQENLGIDNYYQIDVDQLAHIPEGRVVGILHPPEIPNLDVIIAGEIIEHLSNPGILLGHLCLCKCPVILTAPNAYSECGAYYVQEEGIENVNPDHVAWYSWHTLKTLVERHGFTIAEWYWYNGKPLTAEGLIFCLE